MRYDRGDTDKQVLKTQRLVGISERFNSQSRANVKVSLPCVVHPLPKAPFMSELEYLRDQLRSFAAERDWDQFHSPKNLASALSVEAAELLEPFQWLTEEQSRQLTPEVMEQVRTEVADVLLYLIRLSDKLKIDLIAAANEKMILNAQMYPVEKAFGTSKKYTDL